MERSYNVHAFVDRLHSLMKKTALFEPRFEPYDTSILLWSPISIESMSGCTPLMSYAYLQYDPFGPSLPIV